MRRSVDLYVILGLERAASLVEIKKAYKRLARRYHPDINPGDREAEARFRQIVEAYETLSDLDRRRLYDVSGTVEAAGEESAFSFEGFDFSASVHDPATTFGDLFSEVFERRSGTPPGEAPRRGMDLHADLALTFDESLSGVERAVTVTRQLRCAACGGTGSLQSGEARCTTCQGEGAIRSSRGHMVFTRRCPHCRGSGLQRAMACPSCLGAGLETRSETIRIRVQAGMADGARVRIPGKGSDGPFGGEPGDLFILVHVETHPIFRRDGDDLHIVVPIAVHEAALGARVDVPSPDGPVRLRVPAGAQSGQRFHLKGRGAASVRDGRRGDLVVEVKLVMPAALDERSKELMREFGRLNGEDVRAGLDPRVTSRRAATAADRS